MKKLMKYETPELEITKFDIGNRIMDFGGGGGDGDIVTDAFGPSETETQTDVIIDWE